MAVEGIDQSGARKRKRLAAGIVVALVVIAVFAAFALSQGGPAPPGPSAPSPPTNVSATAGDGRLTVAWDPSADAVAYHVYMASVPGVTRDGYASLRDGARFGNVGSPYTVPDLQNGRTYFVRVTAANAAGESAVSAEASATPQGAPPGTAVYVTGLAEFDTGAPVAGATVTLSLEDGPARVLGTTGPDGRFNLEVRAQLPDRVLAEVHHKEALGPSVTGFRWSPLLASGGAVDVGRILLPDPANKRLAFGGGFAASMDGSIVVTDLPPEVASLWARAYDPDAVPDAFPGDLAEGRSLPLNSVVFLWISAADAAGAPVVDLGAPALVRIRVPATQWVDLDDLQPGNGVIDTPIYSFDYGTGYWVREVDGRLTDSAGVAIDEVWEASILRGTYAGEVYAEFRADHFSWWNVDKPPKECAWDYGDAPDPTYPSLRASDGARHQDICRAWLGAWVDGEDDADVPDGDRYDDGLLARDPIKVRVSNWNWSATLYLNALIDGNADGDWDDAGEWAIQNLPVSLSKRKGKTVETDVTWSGDTWLRLTLTGAKISDYNGTGEFPIGETEDYPFLKQRLSVWVTGNGTVTSDPAGIDCRRDAGPCSAEFKVGTVVNLTAAPDSGESFIGWGGDCSGTNATCTLVMDRDHQVYASFTAPFYRLMVYVAPDPSGGNQTWGNGTVTSDPPGINCRGGRDGTTNPKNCTAVFPRGTNVTLTATPDPGWRFDHWAGDCQGTDPTCTVTMNRDRYVVAYFAKP